MKHLIISISTGAALALATMAQAKQDDNSTSTTKTVHRGSGGNSQTQVAPARTQHVTRSSSIQTQRSVSNAPVRTHTYRNTAQFNGNAKVRSSTVTSARVRERSANTTVRSNTAANARVQNNVAVNRDRNFRNRNLSGNAATNIGVNRNRNVTVTNNWRGSRFSGQQYAAFRNYHRQWHNRSWWSSHYNRIIFVGGGWYFWNEGYWYPAWGYGANAYYPYDGPIYGYGNLSPDRIVVEVQTQLQRDGYYAGPIDGALGPMTRQAIAAFQADHGLAITSTVDEPTLSTLGLS